MADSSHACFFIEPGWSALLATVGESVWISSKRRGEKGSHSKICREEKELSSEGFEAKLVNTHLLSVIHSCSKESAYILAPEETIEVSKQLTGLSVSDGGLMLCCTGDNDVLIVDTATKVIRRQLKGHLAEVYRGLIFPSGIVSLTAGADMQIRITSLLDGNCPVTIKGHLAPVTDLAIVDRGRNVISVSKDGSARLWSCGSANCLALLLKLNEQINCCSLIVAPSLTSEVGGSGETQMTCSNPEEVNTDGKVLAVGSEEGHLALVHVQSRRVITSCNTGSAVNSVDGTENFIVAGCEDGRVMIYQASSFSTPINVVHDSNSPVRTVKVIDEGVVCVGRQDGSLTLHLPSTRVHLSGPDCTAVTGLDCDSEFLFAANKDGKVRKYRLSHITKLMT